MSSKQQLQDYIKRLKKGLEEKDKEAFIITNELVDLRIENAKLKYEATKKSLPWWKRIFKSHY